jgi:hypothetical protein
MKKSNIRREALGWWEALGLYPQGLSFEYIDRLVDGRHWAGGIRRFLHFALCIALCLYI